MNYSNINYEKLLNAINDCQEDVLYPTLVEKLNLCRQLSIDLTEVVNEYSQMKTDIPSSLDLSLTLTLFMKVLNIIECYDTEGMIKKTLASKTFVNRIDPVLTKDTDLQLSYVQILISFIHKPFDTLKAQLYPRFYDLIFEIADILFKSEEFTHENLKILYRLLNEYTGFEIERQDINKKNNGLIYLNYSIKYIQSKSLTLDIIKNMSMDELISTIYDTWKFYKLCTQESYKKVYEDG